MKDRTIRATLTEFDLWFIHESMTCNVPRTDDMSVKEKATYDKMTALYLKVMDQ